MLLFSIESIFWLMINITLVTRIRLAHCSTCCSFSQSSIEVLDLEPSMGFLEGFVDGFRAGDYGYLVPGTHAKVARFDLATFQNVEFLNLTDADPELFGFWGGVKDSTYGYLVTSFGTAGKTGNGKVVRFVLQTFQSSDVSVLDMTAIDPTWTGFRGICSDGTYGYTMPEPPNDNVAQKVVRFELSTFTHAGQLDLSGLNANKMRYKGCITDSTGRGYLLPVQSTSGHRRRRAEAKVTRFSLSYFTLQDASILTISARDPSLTGFCTGFADSKYGYLTPALNTEIGRFPLKATKSDFEHILSARTLDIGANFSGCGGFEDGTYGYPVNNHKDGYLFRFELASFSNVESVNLCEIDPTLNGFKQGFKDEHYGYLVPSLLVDDGPRAKVVRFPLRATSPPSVPPPFLPTVTPSTSSVTTSTSMTTIIPTISSTAASSTISSTATLLSRIEDTQKTTTPGDIFAIACHLIITVTNATSFVEDPSVGNALMQSIADMFNVSTSWVHDLLVALKSRRILSAEASLPTEQNGNVDIKWHIIIPAATNEATVLVYFHRFDSLSIGEVTRIINARLAEIDDQSPYDLEVTWKYARLSDGQDSDDSPEQKDGDKNSSTSAVLLAVVVVAGLSGTVMLVLVSRMFYKSRKAKMRLLGGSVNSNDSFYQLTGCLESSAELDVYLHPPDAITVQKGDDIRRLAQSIHQLAADEVEVFLTYATGNRPSDAEGMGPGMFFAAAIILALHRGGVPCFSELMLPWESRRSEFAETISSSTSCKLLIVVQTPALYRCKYALKEIFMAHKHNMCLLPVCFEGGLPPKGAEWPQITRSDVEGMLMVSQVQSTFCNLMPVPTPPVTVPDDPNSLEVLLTDVRSKLATLLPKRKSLGSFGVAFFGNDVSSKRGSGSNVSTDSSTAKDSVEDTSTHSCVPSTIGSIEKDSFEDRIASDHSCLGIGRSLELDSRVLEVWWENSSGDPLSKSSPKEKSVDDSKARTRASKNVNFNKNSGLEKTRKTTRGRHGDDSMSLPTIAQTPGKKQTRRNQDSVSASPVSRVSASPVSRASASPASRTSAYTSETPRHADRTPQSPSSPFLKKKAGGKTSVRQSTKPRQNQFCLDSEGESPKRSKPPPFASFGDGDSSHQLNSSRRMKAGTVEEKGYL